MPSKTYRCENFANCDLALSKEPIEIETGNDEICPGCNQKLTEIKVGKPVLPSWAKYAAIGLVVVILIAAGAWFLMPAAPNPALADTMLTDYFPRLK